MKFIHDSGFEAFSKGTLGNGGQNIYVSKKGVIQRINLLDVNLDGYPDIPLANSHSDNPRVPTEVYALDGSGERLASLYSEGSFCAALADLNGDGYQDLIVGNQYNGVNNLNWANVYYGDPKGFSLRRMIRLYAPGTTALAAGDFDGSGHPDIVFFGKRTCRVYGNRDGIVLDGCCTEHTIPGGELVEFAVSCDFDGDGYDDVAVKFGDGTVLVLWGSPEGLDFDHPQTVYQGHDTENKLKTDAAAQGGVASLSVLAGFESYRLRRLTVQGTPCLFLYEDGEAAFYTWEGRTFREWLRLPTGPVCSAAAGDLDGDGYDELIFTSLTPDSEGKEHAAVWFGGPDGFSADRTQRIETARVRDVVLDDPEKTGRADVFFVPTTNEFYNDQPILRCRGGVLDLAKAEHIPSHACAALLIDGSNPETGRTAIVVNRNDSHNDGDEYSYIYLGSAEGYDPARRIELKGWAPTEMKIADYNDDGLPDVLIANDDENKGPVTGRVMPCYLYFQDGNGFDNARRVDIPSPHTMSALVADVDKDGELEIITAGFTCDFIDIWHADGKGGYTNQRIDLKVPTGLQGEDPLTRKPYPENANQPRFLCIGDINNDGWLDIYVPMCDSKSASAIVWGGPEGYSADRVTLLPVEYSICGKFYDLDGDGWLDLISGSFYGAHEANKFMSNTTIYWGGPDGYSPDRRTTLPGYGTVDLTVADFTNNGMPDIFVCNYNGAFTRNLECYLFYGEKGGIYSADNMMPIPLMSCSGALAMDFNGDGYVDLAVSNHKTGGNHRGDSMILWNGPDGMSRANVTRLPAVGPHGLTHQDYTNVMTGGFEEFYTSRVFDLGAPAAVIAASYEASEPKGSWVTLTVRAADTEEALEAAEFTDAAKLPAGRFVQYRLALGSKVGSTPRVTGVKLALSED